MASRKKESEGIALLSMYYDEEEDDGEEEEGELESSDHAMVDVMHQSANGDFHEKTPPGSVHILTPGPGAQATPRSPEHEQSQPDQMNYETNDSEIGEAADPANASEAETKDVDPLDNFLHPPAKAKCSVELQERINKFLLYKKAGKSFNAEVRNRKDYRNPDFLLHAVSYQDIDQIGSCFSKDVFDPHGYDKSDYVEEIDGQL